MGPFSPWEMSREAIEGCQAGKNRIWFMCRDKTPGPVEETFESWFRFDQELQQRQAPKPQHQAARSLISEVICVLSGFG